MLFVKHISSILPQSTFDFDEENKMALSVDNKLMAKEPSYEGIPNNVLRRMGKAVRMSVGAALPLLKTIEQVDGIIIGTANGGMEDSIKFMNQIIQYNEDTLAPGNFVQSTPNGIAAQIALTQKNKNYNITHAHRGLSFENALLDAVIQLNKHPDKTYLLGATDEISTYNFTIDLLAGWYKKEIVSNTDLFQSKTDASIAGEGSVMLLVDKNPEQAIFEVRNIKFWHGESTEKLSEEIKNFLNPEYATEILPDVFISGENGDQRLKHYYDLAESTLPETCSIARFKHLSGEYPTAVSQAFALASHIFSKQSVPGICLKKSGSAASIQHILLYNTYQGQQHSLMHLTKEFK